MRANVFYVGAGLCIILVGGVAYTYFFKAHKAPTKPTEGGPAKASPRQQNKPEVRLNAPEETKSPSKNTTRLGVGKLKTPRTPRSGSSTPRSGFLLKEEQDALRKQIVGCWVDKELNVTAVFKKNGSLAIGGASGKFFAPIHLCSSRQLLYS